MFKKNFIVRWSEIDPNMHLTSSAYVKYVTDVRMDFFEEQQFGLEEMIKHKIGPIVLSEKCYYFSEVKPGQNITVTFEQCGHTKDLSIIKLEQRIYDENGKNNFLSFTTIAFLDLIQRRIAEPPEALKEILIHTPKTAEFKILQKKSLRDLDAFPKDRLDG